MIGQKKKSQKYITKDEINFFVKGDIRILYESLKNYKRTQVNDFSNLCKGKSQKFIRSILHLTQISILVY